MVEIVKNKRELMESLVFPLHMLIAVKNKQDIHFTHTYQSGLKTSTKYEIFYSTVMQQLGIKLKLSLRIISKQLHRLLLMICTILIVNQKLALKPIINWVKYFILHVIKI